MKKDILLLLSLLYLEIPYYLYFGFWVQTFWSAFFIILLTLGNVLIVLPLYKNSKIISLSANEILGGIKEIKLAKALSIFTLILLAIFWVKFSGAGGFSFQNGDYLKHNAIIGDLINRTWPVFYKILAPEKILIPLRYYFAYYLPGSFVAKIFSPQVTNWFFYCWTLVGVLLTFSWLFVAIGRKSLLAALIFIFWGGLDIIPTFFKEGGLPQFTQHIEWWLPLCTSYQYTGNSALLYWVPQQVLSIWIIMGIFYDLNRRKEMLHSIGFIFSLAVFWSPLCAVGMVPFATINFLKARKMREIFSVNNMIGLSLCLFFLSYYIADLSGLKFEFESHIFSSNFWTYASFIFFEFLIFIPFCYRILQGQKISGNLYYFAAFAMLFLIPFIKYGLCNDFCMRVSVPSLFVLQILVLKNIFIKTLRPSHYALKGALLLLCLIGSQSGLREITRGIVNTPGSFLQWKSDINYDHFSLRTILPYAPLYVGDPQGLYYKYFSREAPTLNNTQLFGREGEQLLYLLNLKREENGFRD